MRSFLFVLTLFFTAITRFWRLFTLPPLFDSSFALSRMFSACSSIGSVVMVFLLTQKLVKNYKISLLAMWVTGILPWTIEQGRVASQPNISLFLFLLFSFFFLQFQKWSIRVIISALFILSVFFVYPEFWLFRTNGVLPSLSAFFKNLFFLLSPELLFFENSTYWWGGVHDVGVVYLSLAPFLFLGFLFFLKKHMYKFLLLFGFFTVLSALSPFLPESREFFLAVPFFSICIAFGIEQAYRHSHRIMRFVFFLLFFLLLYDMAQFFHRYTVHYPQRVQEYKEKLYGAF